MVTLLRDDTIVAMVLKAVHAGRTAPQDSGLPFRTRAGALLHPVFPHAGTTASTGRDADPTEPDVPRLPQPSPQRIARRLAVRRGWQHPSLSALDESRSVRAACFPPVDRCIPMEGCG